MVGRPWCGKSRSSQHLRGWKSDKETLCEKLWSPSYLPCPHPPGVDLVEADCLGPGYRDSFPVASIPDKILTSTVIMYICSPSNPHGSVASLDYLKKAIFLARKHNFILALDECYSDIFRLNKPKPPGGLDAAYNLGDNLDDYFITDPFINISTAVFSTFILIIFGAIAGYIPAKRAASIKPIVALRDE